MVSPDFCAERVTNSLRFQTIPSLSPGCLRTVSGLSAGFCNLLDTLPGVPRDSLRFQALSDLTLGCVRVVSGLSPGTGNVLQTFP